MKNKMLIQRLNKRGTTLVELMVVLGIFAILMSGFFAAYIVQVRNTTKEYKIAETDVEFEVGKSIIERDMLQAGYGFAYDYQTSPVPTGLLPINAANDDPDTITLRGTAVGRSSSSTAKWSYLLEGTSSYQLWTDADEDIRVDDRVIYLDPAVKTILIDSGDWFKTITAAGTSPVALTSGNPLIIYGLATANPATPLYAVRYYLGGASPAGCAPNTQSLLRAESNDTLVDPANGDPILSCVRSFQVAFGLDTDEDSNKTIDCWDNGGGVASGYSLNTLKRRLRQMRIYILVQVGNRDPEFSYENPTPVGGDPHTIRVGDLNLNACAPAGGGVGVNVTLAGQELQYRWKVITLNVKPRNLR